MYKYRFSIFTATHNRSKSLLKLSQIILNQSFKGSYEWLIVNDGSSDDTDQIVKDIIIPQSSIPIHYISQNNGGKHTAWKTATPLFSGRYVVTCDDDDPVSYDMLEVFDNYWKEIEESNIYETIWEVRARCCYENGMLIGPKLKSPYLDISYNDLVYKLRCRAEMLACRKVEVLRQEASVPNSFIFEKYCTNFPEGVRWSRAGARYLSRIVPDILRTYIIGHESLCTSVGKERSLNKNYNSLVSALYSINYCGDVIRSKDILLYLKLVFILAYSSIRVKANVYKYIDRVVDKIIYCIFYIPALFVYLFRK